MTIYKVVTFIKVISIVLAIILSVSLKVYAVDIIKEARSII